MSLDEDKQELYVADRENGRVLVFGALSGKLLRVISDGFGDTVYAISFKGICCEMIMPCPTKILSIAPKYKVSVSSWSQSFSHNIVKYLSNKAFSASVLLLRPIAHRV